MAEEEPPGLDLDGEGEEVVKDSAEVLSQDHSRNDHLLHRCIEVKGKISLREEKEDGEFIFIYIPPGEKPK